MSIVGEGKTLSNINVNFTVLNQSWRSQTTGYKSLRNNFVLSKPHNVIRY